MYAIITKIEDIKPHNNADKLEIAYVFGMPSIIGDKLCSSYS